MLNSFEAPIPGDPPVTTSVDIWDKAWELAVAGMPGFKTYRQAPIIAQTQPEELPILCSYMVDQSAQSWGDSDTGPVKLIEQIQIGFSALLLDSSMEGQHRKLANLARQLDDVLFRDPSFISFELIKGVEQRRIRFVSGRVGSTPTTEFHYLLTVSVINTWPPPVVDDFKVLHEETIFPIGGTEDEIAATPQVKVVIDIPQN